MIVPTYQPVSLTRTVVTEISYFTVEVTNVILSTQATLQVRLFDSKKQFLDLETLILKGEDYTKWGADDSYITTFVVQQLSKTNK